MKKEQAIKELGIKIDYTKLKNGKKYEVVNFNSCDEMIKKMQTCSEDYKMYMSNEQNARPGGKDEAWAYGELRNYDNTLEYLSEGKVLPAVQKRAEKIYNDLTSQPSIQEMLSRAETFKRKKVYSEEGAELSIDHVMSGDPAHWIKTTRGRKMPLVKIGVNIAGSAAEDESLFNQITAISGVVTDILTRAGFSVELYACSTGRDITPAQNYTTVLTRLKAAEEFLDLNRIYSVGCQGYFRCWIFKVYKYILEGDAYDYLGCPQDVTGEMKDALGLDYIIDSSFRLSDNNRSAYIKIEKMFNEVLESH